jgi:hypothetical protein
LTASRQKPRLKIVMDATIIGVGLFIGMLCGGLTALGLGGALSGRVLVNPRHIAWSLGEARIVGLTWTIQGMTLGLITLFGVVQLTTNLEAPPWLLPLVVAVGGGGFLIVVLVAQHHNRRATTTKL